MSRALSMEAIVGWAKRRGFVFASSELYGGIGAGYDYGPLGAQLKNNLTRAWWRDFVEHRRDCMALETSQLLNPRVWEASGHVAQFTDPLSVCATCKRRVRADKAVQGALDASARSASGRAGAEEPLPPLPEWLASVRQAATLTLPQLGRALEELRVPCPGCGALSGSSGSSSGKAARPGLGEPRNFNMLFQTCVGPLEAGAGGTVAHLRPETAQGAYVQFANILSASRQRLPFGVGQVGKSFRNEIAVGNFLFRTREFDQAELQYFCQPQAAPSAYAQWVDFSQDWLVRTAGLRRESLRAHAYAPGELAHYARDTTDIMFHFPFGWEELMGIANRGDFDLSAHSKASGLPLVYRDPVTNEVCTPYVVEPALGLNRLLLAMFCDGLRTEAMPDGSERTVFHCTPDLAPMQAKVLPLLKREGITECSEALHKALLLLARVGFDAPGSIGTRYRRADEEGTPLCITVDPQSPQDQCVTVRDRDSMAQVRVSMAEVVARAEKRELRPSTWFPAPAAAAGAAALQ